MGVEAISTVLGKVGPIGPLLQTRQNGLLIFLALHSKRSRFEMTIAWRGILKCVIYGLTVLTLAISWARPSSAQPAGPLSQIGFDPYWGPICLGIPEPGFGAGPCHMVQRELMVRERTIAVSSTLVQVGFHPAFGPICASQFGTGPCGQVARWIALRDIAAQQVPAPPPVGFVPGIGPICAGPLGIGPCEAVRQYLAQLMMGGTPQQLQLRQIQPVGPLPDGTGPACQGPFGNVPCALVGQFGLDLISKNGIPGQGSFGLPSLPDASSLATECARRSGLDIGAFAGCTGQQLVLTERQQDILDCAVKSPTANDFGRCAAPLVGIRVSPEQRILAHCAMRAKGEPTAFSDCAGQAFANGLGDREQKILTCARSATTAENFATCAAPEFIGRQEQAVLRCATSATDAIAFVKCAEPHAAIRMSNEQRVLARCALASGGQEATFFTCAGTAFAGGVLGSKERAVLDCAAKANGDATNFASCAAGRLIDSKLSREQSIALQCAAESGGNPEAFATCAGLNMFAFQLNPEQQIAVQCLVGTGGAPPAAAGCIASRLTLRELTKCLTDGFGGRGCFGDSNDLVGRNGFVRRTLGQLAGGPNSLVNNPDQIWGGDNSFVRNPSQIWGGPNSFVRNPGQIFGGPNSIFNNPGQLAPRPVQIGRIGGKRICLPWC